MTDITDAGRNLFQDLSRRYGLSEGAVEAMARAVAQGGGGMAQFNIPELGGSGQWMAGGMTMVGDMFNQGLQGTVANLCGELSAAMAQEMLFAAPQTIAGAAWWPQELGSPASVGGQNQTRYAYFPDARRIAFDPGNGAPVILLDTGEHQIGGWSQQQSGPGDPFLGVSFSSQFGQFALSSLPRIGGPADAAPAAILAPQPTPAPAPAPAPMMEAQPTLPDVPQPAPSSAPGGAASDEILETIAKLASLRDSGALTEEEFATKKAELLARL
ncbi:MAG: SHOCT domain-containing protein [Neomegalonema sp.]|nr:SHOCT domain-containing protein [Neomegalonema sp.]